MATLTELSRVYRCFLDTDAGLAQKPPSYIVETEFYNSLANFEDPISIVLSVKGSGKSTLVNLFENKANEDNQSIVISYKPTETIAIDSLDAAPAVYADAFYKQILAMSLEAIDSYAQMREASGVFEDIKSEVRSIVSPISKVWKYTLGQVESIGYKGFKINFSNFDREKFSQINFNTDDAISILEKASARGISVFFVFDDPEKMFKDQTNYENGLIGLLLACDKLNGTSKINDYIFCLVLIRFDVHLRLNAYPDDQLSGMHTDKICQIVWNGSEFIKLVEERLQFANLKWENVFKVSRKRFREKVFPVLRNGPRDLVYLVSQAIKIAKDNAGKKKKVNVTENDLDLAFKKLSAYSCGQLKAEFERDCNYPAMMREIFKSKESYNYSDLESRIVELLTLEGEVYRYLNKGRMHGTNEFIVELLEAGVLQLVNEGRSVKIYDRDFLDHLNNITQYLIAPHPLLLQAA